MVEGAGSDDFRTVKSMLYARPDLMHRILDINAQAVAAYLNAQIEAGAQAVMIFDTWGGALADGIFQRFSLHYIEAVVQRLVREHDGARVPVITFTKGGGLWLEDIAACGVDAVGLDWTVDLKRARERVGARRNVSLSRVEGTGVRLEGRRKRPPFYRTRARLTRRIPAFTADPAAPFWRGYHRERWGAPHPSTF
jgi:uroporphyrinogen-III decarboxylase